LDQESHKHRARDFAVWPGAGSPVSLATGVSEVSAFTNCVLHPPPFPRDAARGNGQPVLVIPGMSSPDMTTARMRLFLKKQGFVPYGWGQGPNIGPTAGAMRRVLGELDRLSDRHGTKVALVGLSLGGIVAREIAKRRPDVVSRVVTLVSPIKPPVPTTLAPLVHLIAFTWERDRAAPVAELEKPPPVPLTAVVTKDDGLVDWRSCVPDSAPDVDVVFINGAHVTIGSNPDAQRVVAARLALS
jgi:pimeloyl-ACP methyl ester carboxylesterase